MLIDDDQDGSSSSDATLMSTTYNDVAFFSRSSSPSVTETPTNTPTSMLSNTQSITATCSNIENYLGMLTEAPTSTSTYYDRHRFYNSEFSSYTPERASQLTVVQNIMAKYGRSPEEVLSFTPNQLANITCYSVQQGILNGKIELDYGLNFTRVQRQAYNSADLKNFMYKHGKDDSAILALTEPEYEYLRMYANREPIESGEITLDEALKSITSRPTYR